MQTDTEDTIPSAAQRGATTKGRASGGRILDDDYDDDTGGYDNMSSRAPRRKGGAVTVRQRQGIHTMEYASDSDTSTVIEKEVIMRKDKQQPHEWTPGDDTESGVNFALDTEVFVTLRNHYFANTLLIATVMFALAALVRGIISLVASVSDVEINMDHLHIADTVIFVFGVFILISGISFFYIQDYMETTYRHKKSVLIPYAAGVLAFGAAIIANWTFTRDHGAYLDRDDCVELTKYATTHIFYVVGAIIVLVLTPEAIFAHRYPERETQARYSIVPRYGHY